MIAKDCKRLAEADFPIGKALKRVVQDPPIVPRASIVQHRTGRGPS